MDWFYDTSFRGLDEKTMTMLLKIKLVYDETGENHIFYINDPQTELNDIFHEFASKINRRYTLQFVYNERVISAEQSHSTPTDIGMENGDIIHVKMSDKCIDIGIVDQYGKIVTISTRLNQPIGIILEEYSTRMELNSMFGRLLIYKFMYKNKNLTVGYSGTLAQLGIVSDDEVLITFTAIIPSQDDIDLVTNSFPHNLENQYLVGQCLLVKLVSEEGESYDKQSFGRVTASEVDGSGMWTWTVEFPTHTSVYNKSEMVKGLKLYYERGGIIFDLADYMTGLVNQHATDLELLSSSWVDGTSYKQVAEEARKIILKALEIEKDLYFTLIFVEKTSNYVQEVQRAFYAQQTGFDRMMDKLNKMVRLAIRIRKGLMEKQLYKVIKPVYEVGDSIAITAMCYSDHDLSLILRGMVKAVKEYDDIDGYGNRREYSILLDSGDIMDDIEDYQVISIEDYKVSNYIKQSDWKGVKHVYDRESSDPWARERGWYTADIDGIEELFVHLSDALQAYDAHTMLRYHTLQEDMLNVPKYWAGIIINIMERFTDGLIEMVAHDYLRIMLVNERLIDPNMRRIGRSLLKWMGNELFKDPNISTDCSRRQAIGHYCDKNESKMTDSVYLLALKRQCIKTVSIEILPPLSLCT